MKAESSWAWSGEWVKVDTYESQSMKGVGLGIQQEVRKRAGLEVSLEKGWACKNPDDDMSGSEVRACTGVQRSAR